MPEFRNRYLLAQQRGQWDWYHVHLIHSKLVKELASQQVVRLAARMGASTYFVHVTAKEGLDAIAEGRCWGLPVYREVLTLAFSFTCDRYKEADEMKYHTYPSLKYEEDQRYLWNGLLRTRWQWRSRVERTVRRWRGVILYHR